MSVPVPTTPAAYDVHIAHRRRDPIDHALTHDMTTWLVDFDDLPRLPGRRHRLVRFDRADHVDVRALLREKGVEDPARILMLAQPRVYGYVFNPLSVFYCLDPEGVLTCVVAEVRNTYGGSHSYVLDPEDLAVDKAFYVSPFYPVDGRYTMKLPVPGERLHVSIVLHREGERPFVATMTGQRDPSARLDDVLRSPLQTRAVMAGIRRHGITLYLKGLRPHPRPAHPTPETTPERTDDDQHSVSASPRH